MEIIYAILGAIGIFAISIVITIVLGFIFDIKTSKSIDNNNMDRHNTLKKILNFLYFVVMTILTVNMLRQDINTSAFWSGCFLVFIYVCKFYWNFFDELVNLFSHRKKNKSGNF